MSYLPDEIRAQIAARPESIADVYLAQWRPYIDALGPLDFGMRLGYSILPVVFAGTVAWDAKPYGPEPSRFDLATLFAAPSLACDDYVRLAWGLADLMPQTKRAPLRIAALGWNGGAVGNHAQMMVSDGNETLLLDPTVGIVARVTYDRLLQGKPVSEKDLASLWRYNSDRPIGYFHDMVRDALLGGKYLPSDMLYFADSLEDFNTLGHSETPGSARFRF